MDNKVEFTIYGLDSNLKYCSYCEKAKQLLTDLKMNFKFISVIKEDYTKSKPYLRDEEVINELINKLWLTTIEGVTMPQIFHNDVYIGGYDDLYNYLSAKLVI